MEFFKITVCASILNYNRSVLKMFNKIGLVAFAIALGPYNVNNIHIDILFYITFLGSGDFKIDIPLKTKH